MREILSKTVGMGEILGGGAGGGGGGGGCQYNEWWGAIGGERNGWRDGGFKATSCLFAVPTRSRPSTKRKRKRRIW